MENIPIYNDVGGKFRANLNPKHNPNPKLNWGYCWVVRVIRRIVTEDICLSGLVNGRVVQQRVSNDYTSSSTDLEIIKTSTYRLSYILNLNLQ